MIISDIFKRAEMTALKSRKEKTKVGALLLDENYEIINEACNDYIYPVYDAYISEPLPDKKLYSEHAERHLIYSSIRSGIHDFQDKTLVVTHFPCCDCSRAIILVGIRKIFIGTKYSDENFDIKWKENIQVSHRMLLQNGVVINFFTKQRVGHLEKLDLSH